MNNFFVVRFTNRTDGTSGSSIKGFATEAEAIKEFSVKPDRLLTQPT